ncbi:hypothetical protein C5E44_03645 [Nocardia nova]|nr:hypothetical protein C5E44_03645 [Nocardia nova]
MAALASALAEAGEFDCAACLLGDIFAESHRAGMQLTPLEARAVAVSALGAFHHVASGITTPAPHR